MKLGAKTSFWLKFAAIAAAVIALVAGAIVLGYYYVFSMQQSLWHQLVENVTEVTYQGGYAFETYQTKEREILDRFARKFETEHVTDEQIIETVNTYRAEDGIFSLVVFGDTTDDEGEPAVAKKFFAGTEKIYYMTEEMVAAKGYNDYGESGLTGLFLNDFTGELTLGCYRRIMLEDGTPALATKGRRMKKLRNEFSLSFYNNAGFSYIVNGNGDIMVRSAHKNSNRTFSNVFDIMEQNGNRAEYIQIFKENMQGGESGAMRLMLNRADYVFAFAPIANTDGWYIVAIVPDAAITAHADSILKSTQSFIIIVTIIAAIVVIFLLVTFFYRKKVNEKQAELRYREQLFGILANNTDDVFMMISLPDLRVDYISPNSERVLGIPAQEIKDDVRVLGSIGNKEGLSAATELKVNESLSYERERVHRITGETKYFYETLYHESIDNNNKVIAVISDRTKEKQTEATLKDAMESAQAANMAKSAFLSNMSHDIRTPMNAIIGFTELVKRDAHDYEKVMSYNNKIYASGQYLLGLINDVLDMSKIESGKIVLNISEFNLAEFVDEISTIMRPQAKQHNITLDFEVDKVREDSLLGDKLRINQVLMNILSNAIKYTPEGGRVEFRISELPRINENFAHIRFTVKDTGIGMTEEFRQTIFEPFTREKSSVVNKIQGTGLGMAITKNLVDLMGGTITVESELGKGSTFTVELELRIDEADVNNEFWQTYGIKRTLVVDDDIDVCHNVSEILRDVGLDSHYAQSGEQAIELVKSAADGAEDHFDLILIDMRMPGMNGIETARTIRELAPKDVSILILTAYDWSDLEEDARNAGIDAFLPKPFFISNLKLNIRKLREAKTAAETGTTVEYSLEGKHFLAAEDNELNSEILVELLDMMGVSCDLAANGQIAVEKFNSAVPGTYDAVLMDIQMPIMNGYEATRAIRAGSHPEAKTMPIIAMTANAFAEDINNALEAGMNAHVAKPVDLKLLENVLKDLLVKRPATGE